MSGSSLASVSFQDAVISTSFNSFFLDTLLLGIYTVVYLGTLYIYSSRKIVRNWLVLSAITVLYILNVAKVAIEWLNTSQILGMIGEPKVVVFTLIYHGAGWATLFDVITGFVLGGVADGLLIWRCYNIWNCSLRVIFLPLVLCLVEIGLCLSIIIIASTRGLDVVTNPGTTLDAVVAAGLVATFLLTSVTTVLIAYRIYSVTCHDLRDRKQNPYSRILDVVIQSAAVYSVVSLALAIWVLLVQTETALEKFYATTYIHDGFCFTAGMAPTIMVARVAHEGSRAANRQGTTTISNLEFRERNTDLENSQNTAPSIPL